ncbi:HalOD1 output domain-containing protein [Halorussus pelagicus]|uniref:HalOD1 output domain-containing protein n=1 Tax=Halorussus pelagicus TaxID=2505977 RepID=UPI000FFBD032|nr:HalOD1 output domain-containing protein [Halorussus pelagicus]
MPDEAIADTTHHSTDNSSAFEYRFDEDESVVEAVVRAVETVTEARLLPMPDELAADGGVGHTDACPLHDVIDPDALANLSAVDAHVTFPYAGCTVTVAGSDAVLVSEKSP